MKKTLLICGRYPLPENIGANMRTMNFVRFFRQLGTVDIAYVSKKPGMPKSDLFENEHLLEVKEIPKSFSGRLGRFMRGIPVPIYDFSGKSERMMRSLMTDRNYDYILTRYLHSTIILRDIPSEYKKKVIIDFDDILSGTLYDQTFGALQGPYKKFIANLNRRLLTSYEKKCLFYGASLFCSENDRTKFIQFCNEQNIYVVPNIYDDKSFENYAFGNGFANNNVLLFIGSLAYGPNVQGLKWFIDSVFPEFRKAYPDGKVMIVGRSPSADIRRLSRIVPGVELYADVTDVKEYYKKCRVVIVPLLSGGGTRIKILEASLANRPVLSTPIGADGLDFTDGLNILIFEDSKGFLKQYLNLERKEKYYQLIIKANNTVKRDYSMEKFSYTMHKVLKNIESSSC